MPNPSKRWDRVPVYGVWLKAADDSPEHGVVRLSVTQRVTRVDGRLIYPAGATVSPTIGDQAQQDGVVRDQVRAAWRAADQAADVAAGRTFDGPAWDQWWNDVIVPAAIFTSFFAADDPDIVQKDWEVRVQEQLLSATGREYFIKPLLTQLDQPIPGINLGTVEVPPGAPTVPAPVYAKGVPGGVASLDEQGTVPADQLPADLALAAAPDVEPIPGTIPKRTPTGALAVGAPTEPGHAARRAEVSAVRARTATDAPTIVTLLGGQADETYTLSGCTTSADVTNRKIGTQGLKISVASARTATVVLVPGPTSPLVMPPASAVGLWVYVPDASKITSIGVEINTTADLAASGRWSRSVTTSGLSNGWNLLRWTGSSGLADLSTWGTVYRIRLVVVTNAAADLTIGHIFATCPPRAQVLFIEDRGYRTFVDLGLPDLRALGIPVTWALDPALHGTSVGTAGEVITDEDVAQFAAEGDSISFHSWDGSVTASMTAEQVAVDTVKAIRWLQQRGYTGRIWRAAWTQNSAPQHAAAKPYVLAYATPSSVASLETWPPRDMWNISRWSVHGRTPPEMDAVFTSLRRSHGLLICYTHGVHPTLTGAVTPEEWAYFVEKLREGVEGGWLEGVTFEDLYARSGGTFREGFGQPQAEYMDAAGALVRRDLL